jgi:hypothetical protein
MRTIIELKMGENIPRIKYLKHGSGKIRYPMEFINHKKLKVPRSRVEIKNEILKVPISSEDSKHELNNYHILR